MFDDDDNGNHDSPASKLAAARLTGAPAMIWRELGEKNRP